ncbi:MAG TPA: amidohydrolase family protein [Terriglobia bacterium]|nr:amidohydrolase family protein [Terriglobia bacterium]
MNAMPKRWYVGAAVLWPLLLAAQSTVPPEVAEHGYADLIVVNGKVVSMDDPGVNENPGNVYEAMAVKKDRIIALGTSQYIRTLANAKTKVFDLQGRMVFPGIIETHAHLFGGGELGAQMGLRVPDKGVSIRVRAGKDVEATRLVIEDAIRNALKEVAPGEWVMVGVGPNPQEGVSSNRVVAWFAGSQLETKDRLDRVAPDNPVLVQGGIRGALNSKAMELAKQYMPEYEEFINQSTGDDDSALTGEVGSQEMGALTYEIFYRGKPISLIAEMFRRDLEIAAAHGVTTFSSRVPHPLVLDGFTMLNREGKMPIRFAALYEVHRRPGDPEVTRNFYRLTGNLTGVGNDYFWIHGVASERWDTSFPMQCLGPDAPAPAAIKRRELCPEQGDMFWDTLQNALESGWRLAGIHGLGSDGVRRFLKMVDMARANRGMSDDDIKDLRLTVEHGTVIGKLPDVMQQLKRFGVIISAGPPRLLRYPDYLQDYGPQITPFMLPVKTWLDAGIKVVGQNHTYQRVGALWTIFMNRLVNGQVVNPEERLGRGVVAKMWTRWAAEYVMKEKDLGSLEVGKIADFVVLDKDYFAIPVEEIALIQPQLTVVGGKVVYLRNDYAGKLGMEPVGYQFPPNCQPWKDGCGGPGGGA